MHKKLKKKEGFDVNDVHEEHFIKPHPNITGLTTQKSSSVSDDFLCYPKGCCYYWIIQVCKDKIFSEPLKKAYPAKVDYFHRNYHQMQYFNFQVPVH